ncbi:Gfo/Idh/MocA family oxidoreductase [Streptomyces sp. NPDC002825]|uniref:Gfo/Idh/MocA family protein n=1 Tax=Streptomyces sp. NPDC002825 TaxID=3154666 RepID=UPI00331C3104
MTEPLRWGVLGCADIAVRRVLPTAARLPEFALTAVASRDAAKAEATAARFGGRPVSGYDRLLEREDVDAVYVPLPTGMHAEWIARALRAGKHVFAEKPLTHDVGRTRELVGLAEGLGLVLRENFMFLHHGQQRRVRQLVRDGAVGEPRLFSAAFAVPPRDPSDIRYDARLGGGALLDVGAYPVRAALYFLGDGLRVAGARLRHDPAYGVDVAGSALLAAPGGATAQLAFGFEHHYTSRYEILGSEGRITVEPAFTPLPDHEPVIRWERRGGVELIRLSPDDQCANALRAFADAVRRKDPAPDPGLLEQARLLDLVRGAAAGV